VDDNFDVQSEAVGVGAGARHGGLADVGEVGSFPVVEFAFAAGEGEKGFDEALLLVAGGEQVLGSGSPRFCVGVGVVERDLQHGAFGGEWSTEFVGGVRDEVSLRLEGGVETSEEVVEGVPQFLELVLRPVRA
jgi:hypothetical protein